MANDDRSVIPPSAARGSAERGLYIVVGAVVVMMLVGAYVAIGTPGLHTQIAHAPMEVMSDR